MGVRVLLLLVVVVGGCVVGGGAVALRCLLVARRSDTMSTTSLFLDPCRSRLSVMCTGTSCGSVFLLAACCVVWGGWCCDHLSPRFTHAALLAVLFVVVHVPPCHMDGHFVVARAFHNSGIPLSLTLETQHNPTWCTLWVPPTPLRCLLVPISPHSPRQVLAVWCTGSSCSSRHWSPLRPCLSQRTAKQRALGRSHVGDPCPLIPLSSPPS